MKKGKYIIFILILSMTVFSCKKKKEPVEPVNTDKDYYPSTIGKYIVYDVDSIIFNEFTYDSTHYKYQIKEKIEEQFTDIQGRPALKMARYIKKFSATTSYSAMPWTIKDVWQVNITATNVEVVEENIRFIKLTFPIKENNKWNGNLYNTMDEWDYTYTFTDKAEQVNGNGFDHVALVTQKNFRTLISDEYYAEKYAKGYGLVYREIIDLDFDEVVPLNADIFTVAKKKGVFYKQAVNSWGNE